MSDFTRLPAGLPVPEDDGAADHLVRLAMPGVELAATTGGTVRLDTLGGGRTIIYIYPMTGPPDGATPAGWDEIPGARGCTVEACAFRDHHEDLRAAGASHVLGLSSQDTAYQREVVERLHLPFPMLSDTSLSLGDALGLPTFTVEGRRLYKRLTLVVRNGMIEHVFYPVFPPNEHAGQVLDWLAARA